MTTLKILLDENIPLTVSWWLLTEGHDVLTVRDVGLSGRSDETLNAYLHREGRILLTLDLDFSDPIKLPVAAGRIVLHPDVTDGELICRMLRRFFALGLPRFGELYVVQPDGIARYDYRA
ncbi:DUF5615 family PIN-like protein [Calidithermus roseus]|uniref:DUF5615 domain-containing protein n=1 Tax=Calidithermus roseus TaxID=1644118 RepID=A0A399F1I3_9DEIN|nr:DUF5615 family PIN-like protein [Calidithermus roseus]RIH89850.1 hypothetical protein Mrose_00075 [Calidithermus roseus]